VGSCARLRNGPAHRPRASSNSEPRSCASSTFSSFFPHHHVPLLFSFSSPLPPFFILSIYHTMPPTAVLHHLPSHLFHLPPRCPHHRCRSQCTCRQTCPTAAAFANLLLYSIIPHVFPSLLSPSSHHVSALPCCQRHQCPPCRRCLTMRTKDTKPLENCHV
jgi:hypothetical protein